MLKNLFLILSEFIVTLSLLVTTNPCTPSIKFERQLKLTNEYFKARDTELKESEENNILSPTNETLFWTLPDVENVTETVLPEMHGDDLQGIQDVRPEVKDLFITEENISSNSNMSGFVKPATAVTAGESTSQKLNVEGFPQKLNDSFQGNEKIILPRYNCQAEIAVNENRDTKLTIKFERLQNNSYGSCCITLSGHENSMLGVVISNIHLYRNNTLGEVLKVIVGNHHTAFSLKEYYGSKDYQPLLLTETHKVYLVLYYKVEYVPPSQDYTYFNLEAFTYQWQSSL